MRLKLIYKYSHTGGRNDSLIRAQLINGEDVPYDCYPNWYITIGIRQPNKAL
jgi:hypothetical protein